MNILNIDPFFIIQQHDEKLLLNLTSPDTLLSLKEESLSNADSRQLENLMVYYTVMLDITAEMLSERNSEHVSIHIDHYPSKSEYTKT